MAKLWGGRFKKDLSVQAKAYSYSLRVDQKLFPYDIQVTCAHVDMLAKTKIITAAEAAKIKKGLGTLVRVYGKKDLSEFADEYEDVHSFIQAQLEQRIGAVAKKMHTARSRNDLVITATKLYLKDKVGLLVKRIHALQKGFVKFASKYQDVIIPGFTHLQHAQAVLLAHHMLAYVEMLERDQERLLDALKRIDEMPLGSGSISGTTLPIDRAYTARLLGFKRISQNSMDAVSDRDSVIEVLSALSVMCMHLSRFSEDVILWNSQEFGFIELSDEYATGSSLMPQKKNPDMLELCRGKVGEIYGHLMSVLVMMKGLPLTYNRDMQQDKKPLFEAIDTALLTLDVLKGVLATSRMNTAKCALAMHDSNMYATDMLDYFVKKGLAFADAHSLVGKIVLKSQQTNKDLSFFSLSDFQEFFPRADKQIFQCFKPERSIAAKTSVGATGGTEVKKRIQYWMKKRK